MRRNSFSPLDESATDVRDSPRAVSKLFLMSPWGACGTLKNYCYRKSRLCSTTWRSWRLMSTVVLSSTLLR